MNEDLLRLSLSRQKNSIIVSGDDIVEFYEIWKEQEWFGVSDMANLILDLKTSVLLSQHPLKNFVQLGMPGYINYARKVSLSGDIPDNLFLCIGPSNKKNVRVFTFVMGQWRRLKEDVKYEWRDHQELVIIF